MKSKIQVAREIRDKGYKMECPYFDSFYGDAACSAGKCEYYEFCIQANDEKVAIFNKEAVDSYIKRYDRSNRKRNVKKPVTRPNFMKAVKAEKEFCVRCGKELAKELERLSGIKKVSNYSKYFGGIKFAKDIGIKKYWVWNSASNTRPIPEYYPETDTFSNAESPVVKNSLTPEQREFWEKVLINGNCDFIACSRCPYSNSYLRCVLFKNFQLDYCNRKAMIAKAKEILETNPKFDNEPELPEWSKTMQKVIKVEGSVAIVASGRYEELLKIEKDYELIKKVLEGGR